MENENGWDAWMQARTGNAIDAIVDRVLHRPQYGSDPAQAYGVDGNGNLYMLGQTNSQITATVAPTTAGGGSMGLLLIVGLVAVLLMGKD